ncbi:pentatricopeptide repeat-containing protein At1g08070, chloroplastic-like [Phalaenopsis equestris]|uniref:pentatricopeptide repeat-containing protein At1g08070, chloroplastic-like n=1 Tax=Phalaenopsis equestris TaxID=78828 RepID=UPI0009E50E83|nr:pentatricopeptide repeat-containing protein At1g08070, chloroplastic-like [Phalaenopsis equestris]
MKISSQWRKPFSVDSLKQHCTSVANCKQAHSFLLRFDLLQENILSSKLLSFLALSPTGDLKYAHQLFDQLSSPDSFIWNTIIRGHARSSNPSQAISFFHHMVSSGVPPDHHSYPFVLTACARMPSPALGKKFHAETFKFGLGSDVFVLNSLIQMYACCGLVVDARKLFDGNPLRDVVSWNVMIRGFVKRGEFDDAFRCFDDMIRAQNRSPDPVTMISLLSACSQLGDFDRGRWLHLYSSGLGFVPSNLQLGNAILCMYCKCMDLLSAKNFFDEMGEKDLLTWTTMINGFSNLGNFRDALDFFSQMQDEGICPDEVVLGTILSVCAQLGALEEGKYVHHLIEKYNVKRDVVLQTALVDMYAKCGRVEFAMQVFKKMKERNVFTWNAMIGGLALHGHGHQALCLYEEMKQEEEEPDDVTFIGLLLGCSHSGLVKSGLKVFNEMEDVYHINPRMEHYGCVVDLLCRSGLVEEALDFIKKMPVKPNEVMWASLFGACRVLGHTKIAEMMSTSMFESDIEPSGRYVILSNLYAGVRRWDEALKVRNLMRAKGINKVPGLSWIELNGIVHQFVAGDRSHNQTEDIYVMVTEMCQRVKLAGHVAGTTDVLFDIEDEEKEHSLFFHSEKLAVAFGLMSTAPGSDIRITKNLRVCRDCHVFLKAISKTFHREIVARDRSRFHHFRGGLCSCKDFW